MTPAGVAPGAEAASLVVLLTRDRELAQSLAGQLALECPGVEVHVLHEIDVMHDHVARAQPDALVIDVDGLTPAERHDALDDESILGTPTLLAGSSPEELVTTAQRARQPVAKSPRDAGLARAVSRFLQSSEHAIGVQRRLQETVQHYRDILEASGDGIFVLLGGIFTYVNESFATAVGRSRTDLIGQLGLADLAEAGDRHLLADELSRLSVVGGKRDLLDVDLHCGTGRRRFEIACRSSLVDGRRTVVGVARDVTAVRELQDEVERARQRATQVERLRALGELAAGVAHDFNNALDAILGRLRRARQKLARGEAAESDLEVVEQAANDAASTVRRISEFARPAGRDSWHDVDLAAAVRDAAELVRTRIPARITFEVAVRPTPLVRGNGAELREMILNLLTNAVDAIEGDGRIGLHCYAKEEQAVIEVEDTGCGMTTEVQARVFEPFFTTKVERGSGLGLSVAHGIVRRHDAEIELESEPGRGTRFRVTFPPPRVQQRSRTEPANTALRILVVDDDSTVAELMRDLLEELGHRVVVLDNARDAVSYVVREPVDLLITDLDLPQASGWQIARSVRRLRPDLCVGLITGWPLGTTEEELHAKGVDFILSKPFSLDALTQALARLRGGSTPLR